MGLPNFLSKLQPQQKENSQSSTPARSDSTVEKDNGLIDDSPVKYLTWRSFILGIVVSMGGFIFGYSTGQISGFTTMSDFIDRFGEDMGNGQKGFGNVRNGLIVGLVCWTPLPTHRSIYPIPSNKCVYSSRLVL